ncbi:MAG: porin family protein [Bacteroidota bacterium]|nr:porin family protein [Bacteroidota bacterium]
MKYFRIFIALAIINLVQAQNKLHVGAKFSPSIAWNRVEPEKFTDASNVDYTFKPNLASIRWGVGMYADYMFADNFGISFGLNYITNSTGFVLKRTPGTEETYKISTSYLQLPVGFKVITNEIFDNGKIYFMPAITLDVLLDARINDKADFQKKPGDPVQKYTKYLNPLASNFTFSSGVEYELSGDLKLTGGLTYSHGLTDIDNTESGIKGSTNNSFALYNHFVSLDIGLRF